MFFEVRFFQLEESRIAQRALDVANKVSVPLSRSLWDYDEKTVLLVLETLMRDPDLVRVRIILPDDAGEFYPSSDLNADNFKLTDIDFIRVPLTYTVFDNDEILGHLEVGYTTERAFTDVWTRIFVDALIFLVILMTLGGGRSDCYQSSRGAPS
ncbi:hypothetical protein [Kiloniella sp.]|uniref:hypothetical protein n=1 Tax=Kiloniella sp. TaxID=1938587 RepID=UPI003B010408